MATVKNWWNWYRKPILWILVVLWMGLIFWFSAQNGEDSSKLSDGITKRVVEIIVGNFNDLPQKQQTAILNRASFLVRKAAHFTEYFILGILLWNLLRCYEIYGKKTVLFSWLIGTIYAVTDELHQMFSDGRAPKVFDVCIDSTGVLFGVLVVSLLSRLVYGERSGRLK